MVTAPPVDFSRKDANSQCMLQRQLGNVGYMPGSGIVYLLQCALVACSSQWPGSVAGWLYSLVCTVLHSFTCRDCPRHGNHAPLEPCRCIRFSFFPYISIHIKQIFENSNNFIKQIAIFKQCNNVFSYITLCFSYITLCFSYTTLGFSYTSYLYIVSTVVSEKSRNIFNIFKIGKIFKIFFRTYPNIGSFPYISRHWQLSPSMRSRCLCILTTHPSSCSLLCSNPADWASINGQSKPEFVKRLWWWSQVHFKWAPDSFCTISCAFCGIDCRGTDTYLSRFEESSDLSAV